jgi:hypothetical protein
VLLSELSARVGITERVKVGRRDRYEVHPDGHPRHPEESTAMVVDPLNIFLPR